MDPTRLTFEGTGFQPLWRSVGFIVGCVLIVPIPWITAWLVRWYVENVEVHTAEARAAGVFL
jgi:hypothetical protein